LNNKTAIITGATGQDGAYLSRLLLQKGYKVIGLIRSFYGSNLYRLKYLDVLDKIELQECDLTDLSQVIKIISTHRPAEIYNLAAQSSVSLSFQQPIGTIKFNIDSVLNLLEGIRLVDPSIRFYQASTSEMYGKIEDLPIKEESKFHPLSPYAISKVTGHHININYRESYGIFASCGILFNHESPLRGETFVTRKITRGVAKIGLGFQDKIFLGNLDARRDWGHAKDYVEAMWRILQQPEPEDYVIATGITTPVREFVRMAFAEIGVELEFRGSADKETGVVVSSSDPDFNVPVGKEVIAVDPKYYRPTEVDLLIGDATKAREKLGWKPAYDLPMLVKEMVNADVQLFRKEKILKDSGFHVKNQYE